MSYTFGLTIESMVAILLLLTILYCARLNKQISKLKGDEQAMKATIAELAGATASAERAIAGLKLTLRDCEADLGAKLQAAEEFSTAITGYLKSGEDVLARLRKIAKAERLLAQAEGETEEPAPPPADTRSIAAAAQALAERARQRATGLAA